MRSANNATAGSKRASLHCGQAQCNVPKLKEKGRLTDLPNYLLWCKVPEAGIPIQSVWCMRQDQQTWEELS